MTGEKQEKPPGLQPKNISGRFSWICFFCLFRLNFFVRLNNHLIFNVQCKTTMKPGGVKVSVCVQDVHRFNIYEAGPECTARRKEMVSPKRLITLFVYQLCIAVVYLQHVSCYKVIKNRWCNNRGDWRQSWPLWNKTPKWGEKNKKKPRSRSKRNAPLTWKPGCKETVTQQAAGSWVCAAIIQAISVGESKARRKSIRCVFGSAVGF